MSEGRTPFALPSPPSDVQLPPYARRLDVRATRAAFTAGTLSTVSDDTAREDAERNGVARDADRCYLHDVEHGHTLYGLSEGHKSCSTSSTPLAESVRLAALPDVSALTPGQAREIPAVTHAGNGHGTFLVVSADFTEHEALRQSRLRRWQTIR